MFVTLPHTEHLHKKSTNSSSCKSQASMSKETPAASDKSLFSTLVNAASSSATAAAAAVGSVAANVHSNYKASIKSKQQSPAEEKIGFGRNFNDGTERQPCTEKVSLAQSVSSAAGAVAAEGLNVTSNLLGRIGIWRPGPPDSCFNVVNRRGDDIVYRYEKKKAPKNQ
ncbi:uncharacterized protein LOC141685977 [Apium graveolens]|uniref:uncharacterized protein LOC141685977 n=1 Tax=Apium graveolens TaxID=4045 RepID=UPI003D79EBC8